MNNFGVAVIHMRRSHFVPTLHFLVRQNHWRRTYLPESPSTGERTSLSPPPAPRPPPPPDTAVWRRGWQMCVCPALLLLLLSPNKISFWFYKGLSSGSLQFVWSRNTAERATHGPPPSVRRVAPDSGDPVAGPDTPADLGVDSGRTRCEAVEEVGILLYILSSSCYL